MKIQALFESTRLIAREINRNDEEGMQLFCDCVNEHSQLSWELTPSRLRQKLGAKGVALGLFAPDGRLAGTAGMKIIDVDGVDSAEVGYMAIYEQFRSLQAVMALYKQLIKESRRYELVFATTVVKNKTINKLLKRTPKMHFAFKARSPYSHNLLYYYVMEGARMPVEQQLAHLNTEFQRNIISEG